MLCEAMVVPTSRAAMDLLAGLDGKREADEETAWTREIERRAREGLDDVDDEIA